MRKSKKKRKKSKWPRGRGLGKFPSATSTSISTYGVQLAAHQYSVGTENLPQRLMTRSRAFCTFCFRGDSVHTLETQPHASVLASCPLSIRMAIDAWCSEASSPLVLLSYSQSALSLELPPSPTRRLPNPYHSIATHYESTEHD